MSGIGAESKENEISVTGLSKTPGPDFIGIGMAKSATGWLFDQLKYHPDFWMPPIKELRYLRRQRSNAANSIERCLKQIARSDRKAAELFGWANREEPQDSRDIQFLQELSSVTGLASYISLFRYKRGKLSGDISPIYASLPAHTISETAAAMPTTKIILLVRDPVRRAWSHTCMQRRSGNIDDRVLQTPRAYREFLETNSLVSDPFATRVAGRWKQHAPNLRFRHFLFDDIVENPRRTLADILLYLGADPDKPCSGLPADYNKKSRLDKLDLTKALERTLIDFFREELLACADCFGGAARDWPKRYGL